MESQLLCVRCLVVSSLSLSVLTLLWRNCSLGCVCRLTSHTSVALCFSQSLLLVSSLHFLSLICWCFSLHLKPIYLQCLASRHSIVTVQMVLSSHPTDMTTWSHWSRLPTGEWWSGCLWRVRTDWTWHSCLRCWVRKHTFSHDEQGNTFSTVIWSHWYPLWYILDPWLGVKPSTLTHKAQFLPIIIYLWASSTSTSSGTSSVVTSANWMPFEHWVCATVARRSTKSCLNTVAVCSVICVERILYRTVWSL